MSLFCGPSQGDKGDGGIDGIDGTAGLNGVKVTQLNVYICLHVLPWFMRSILGLH